MLLRYVSLVLETIPRHSDFKSAGGLDIRYHHLRAAAIAILEELEQLKLKLKLLDRSKLEEAPYLPTSAPGAVRFGAASAGDTDTDAAALELLGTPQWAAALLSQPPSHPPPQPPQLQQPQQPHMTRIEMPDVTPTITLPAASNQMLSKHAVLGITGLNTTSSYTSSGAINNKRPPSVPPTSSPPTSYSQLLVSLQNNNNNNNSANAYGMNTSVSAAAPPLPPPPPPPPSPYDGHVALGPQEVQVTTAPYPTGPPPPDATCCQPSTTTTSSAGTTVAIPPPPPPSTTAITSSTGGGGGGVAEVRKRQRIRDVHLSFSLMQEFLRYALSNTRRGIETCGILAGSLSPDDARFTITALIIPKQEGTTDTVQALAEEEIFEAQDSRALYPLGWIHTHPTQSCFLSSVDVHTQCGYQTMLDEAVAIVMAPSQTKNPMGVFRLTTPGGLSLVQQCPLRGFHAHPRTDTGQPLYEECSNVYLNERVGYEVIDLR